MNFKEVPEPKYKIGQEVYVYLSPENKNCNKFVYKGIVKDFSITFSSLRKRGIENKYVISYKFVVICEELRPNENSESDLLSQREIEELLYGMEEQITSINDYYYKTEGEHWENLLTGEFLFEEEDIFEELPTRETIKTRIKDFYKKSEFDYKKINTIHYLPTENVDEYDIERKCNNF